MHNVSWLKSFSDSSIFSSLKNMFFTYHIKNNTIYHNKFKYKEIQDLNNKGLSLIYTFTNDLYKQNIYISENSIVFIEDNNPLVVEIFSINENFYKEIIKE